MAAFCWLHPTNLGHDLVLGTCALCGDLSSGMYFTDDPLGESSLQATGSPSMALTALGPAL